MHLAPPLAFRAVIPGPLAALGRRLQRSAVQNGRRGLLIASLGQPLVAPMKVRYQRIDSVAFSPDGKWLATGSFGGIIDLWPGNLEE